MAIETRANANTRSKSNSIWAFWRRVKLLVIVAVCAATDYQVKFAMAVVDRYLRRVDLQIVITVS
jgi:hypothetical protein